MPERDWNDHIRLYPTDRLFKATVARVIPSFVTPNSVTVLRMLLVPFIVFFLARGRLDVVIPLFLVTALTDWIDGALARTRKQITEWGIIYDPVADKMLIGAVLFVIVYDHINVLLGVILLVVEMLLITIGWFRRVRGRVEPANIWGKIKMITEVVAITALLVALWFRVNILVDISAGTLALAIVFAVVSVLSRIT